MAEVVVVPRVDTNREQGAYDAATLSLPRSTWM